MELYITVEQGVITVVYNNSYLNITHGYPVNRCNIYIYDYDFKRICYFDNKLIRANKLRFRTIIIDHIYPISKGKVSAIEVSLGETINNLNTYYYCYNINTNELRSVKESNKDKTIIFNDRIMIRYEIATIIKILLLRCFFVQHNILPTELQAEIEDIIYKVSHIALKL